MSLMSSGIATFKFIDKFTFKPCMDIIDKTLTDDFLIKNKKKNEVIYFEKYMLCPVITNPAELYSLSGTMDPPFRKLELKIYPCTLDDNT
jgi:hypothetical protein